MHHYEMPQVLGTLKTNAFNGISQLGNEPQSNGQDKTGIPLVFTATVKPNLP